MLDYVGLEHTFLLDPNTVGLFFLARLSSRVWIGQRFVVTSGLGESLQAVLKEVKISVHFQAPGHLATPSVKTFCHLENSGLHF